MSWKECDCVSLRYEFVRLADVEGANIAALCSRFGIARKTGYKWLKRYREDGIAGLRDQSRRPHHVRASTPKLMEQRVLQVREEHPMWGGRKIRRVLQNRKVEGVPAASTITSILHRHRCISDEQSATHHHWQRFERENPNELWQMDFKGEFPLSNGRWCYPLTVLDDHSRFSLGIRACGNQRRVTVQQQLTSIFKRYGLPCAMLMDNGTPWGSCGWTEVGVTKYTKLKAWLIRLDIRVTHGRPYHPQTQGKEERFHRTMKAELLHGRHFDNLRHAQSLIDPWRDCYNFERPHESLNMETPASRYRMSMRTFPKQLPVIKYGPQDIVRTVNPVGQFSFNRIIFKTSQAFGKQKIGLRPTCDDGVFDVYYCHACVGRLDLHKVERRRKTGRVEPITSARYAHYGDRLNDLR